MKTYLIVFALLLGLNVYGQQSGSKQSKPLTGKEPTLLGSVNGTYYFIQYSDDNALHIINLDDNLNPVENKFPITAPTGKPQASKCMLLGDNIYYFKLMNNKGVLTLYSWKLPTTEMKISAPNELFSVEAEAYVDIMMNKNDANNLLNITYTPYNKNMTAYVATYQTTILFNSELEQQWTKKKEFDKTREILFDEGGGFSYIFVSKDFEEDGVWYKDYRIQEGDAKLKLNPDKYYVEAKSSTGENVLKIELPFVKDKVFTTMEINIKGDTLICAGFYGVDNNIQQSGIYKIEYDKMSGKMLSENYKPFSSTYLQTLKEYAVAMNDNGLKNFKNEKIYFCSNGDVIYTAQESFGGINGNIIILYMNGEGKVQYNKVIRLKQASPVGADYERLKLYAQNNLGYNGIVNDNTLTLYLNDNIENADHDAEDKPEQLWKKDAGAFAFEVSPNGNIKKERIGENDYFYKLGSAIANGDEVLLELIKGEAKTEAYKLVLIK